MASVQRNVGGRNARQFDVNQHVVGGHTSIGSFWSLCYSFHSVCTCSLPFLLLLLLRNKQGINAILCPKQSNKRKRKTFCKAKQNGGRRALELKLNVYFVLASVCHFLFGCLTVQRTYSNTHTLTHTHTHTFRCTYLKFNSLVLTFYSLCSVGEYICVCVNCCNHIPLSLIPLYCFKLTFLHLLATTIRLWHPNVFLFLPTSGCKKYTILLCIQMFSNLYKFLTLYLSSLKIISLET